MDQTFLIDEILLEPVNINSVCKCSSKVLFIVNVSDFYVFCIFCVIGQSYQET